MNTTRVFAIAVGVSAFALPARAAQTFLPRIDGTLPLVGMVVFGIIAVALVVRLGDKYLS